MEPKQTPHPDRITMRSIWHGILDSLSLERGLIGTTITLTKRPGQAIRDYLLEDRSHLMPPFRYLLFMVAIGTFVTIQYFKSNSAWVQEVEKGFQKGYQKGGSSSSESQEFMKAYLENASFLFNNYFNLFILLGVPISAIATFWIFRRRFNYAEHLVINSYLTGYLTVVYIVLTPILFFTDFMILSWIYFIVTIIYSIFVYKKVFQSPGIRGIAASIGAFISYLVVYYIIIIALFIAMAFIALAQQG